MTYTDNMTKYVMKKTKFNIQLTSLSILISLVFYIWVFFGSMPSVIVIRIILFLLIAFSLIILVNVFTRSLFIHEKDIISKSICTMTPYLKLMGDLFLISLNVHLFFIMLLMCYVMSIIFNIYHIKKINNTLYDEDRIICKNIGNTYFFNKGKNETKSSESIDRHDDMIMNFQLRTIFSSPIIRRLLIFIILGINLARPIFDNGILFLHDINVLLIIFLSLLLMWGMTFIVNRITEKESKKILADIILDFFYFFAFLLLAVILLMIFNDNYEAFANLVLITLLAILVLYNLKKSMNSSNKVLLGHYVYLFQRLAKAAAFVGLLTAGIIYFETLDFLDFFVINIYISIGVIAYILSIIQRRKYLIKRSEFIENQLNESIEHKKRKVNEY